ncbi:hypothetical protein BKA62DRAFT_620890 [Auriculariales sp. MPI-PUGE-AT-0066]|nr:hypothetical protein BKA62DRAFT_620890 [Auriculariales sp. MPI-PUGE-AT-0066]
MLFTVLSRAAYGTHVRSFLIDVAGDHDQFAAQAVQPRLQPFLQQLFEGGFRTMPELRALSLPLRLGEAFVAASAVTFAKLQRLELRYKAADQDLVAFVSRHAKTLTYFIYPYALEPTVLSNLAPLQSLTCLHTPPSVAAHVLETQPTIRLQYLGLLCNPHGAFNHAEASSEWLPTILDILRTWEVPLLTLQISEPHGYWTLHTTLVHECDVPLLGIQRLELVSINSLRAPDSAESLRPTTFRDIIRTFPDIHTLKVESAYPGQRLFSGPPLAFARGIIESQPGVADPTLAKLQNVIADGMCLVRTEPTATRFRHHLSGAERYTPWLVDSRSVI